MYGIPLLDIERAVKAFTAPPVSRECRSLTGTNGPIGLSERRMCVARHFPSALEAGEHRTFTFVEMHLGRPANHTFPRTRPTAKIPPSVRRTPQGRGSRKRRSRTRALFSARPRGCRKGNRRRFPGRSGSNGSRMFMSSLFNGYVLCSAPVSPRRRGSARSCSMPART